jgi:hypothetical protein
MVFTETPSSWRAGLGGTPNWIGVTRLHASSKPTSGQRQMRDQVSHPVRRDSGRSSNRNRHLSPSVNTSRRIGTYRGSRDDSFGLHNQASFTPAVEIPFGVKAGRGGQRSFRRCPDHAP